MEISNETNTQPRDDLWLQLSRAEGDVFNHFLISFVPLTGVEALYNLMQLELTFNRKLGSLSPRAYILHSDPRKLSHHHLVTQTHWSHLQDLSAHLHFVSSSLGRCQRRNKKPSSPDTEDLIETAGRALTPCALCGGLISRRDLCTLFKVCKVSERDARRISDWLHIWSGSFRVT